MRYLRLVVFVCVQLASVSSLSTQLPDMHPAAAQMAKAIAKSKQHSVLVFDFYGPGNKFTELGRTLADKFSAALAQSSEKFTVADRQKTAEILEKRDCGHRALAMLTLPHGPLGSLRFLWSSSERLPKREITLKFS